MADAPVDGAPAPESTEQPPIAETTDWEAEAKKWQAEATKQQAVNRKREADNKKNFDELEKLRQASMSDTEKAVAAAVEQTRNDTRTETLKQLGGKLVDAEVRAAVAGRGVDADALLEGLDRSRFLGDDLEPDRAGIAAWVEKIAPKRDASGFDIGQGPRGNGNGGTDLAGDAFEKALLGAVGGKRR